MHWRCEYEAASCCLILQWLLHERGLNNKRLSCFHRRKTSSTCRTSRSTTSSTSTIACARGEIWTIFSEICKWITAFHSSYLLDFFLIMQILLLGLTFGGNINIALAPWLSTLLRIDSWPFENVYDFSITTQDAWKQGNLILCKLEIGRKKGKKRN